ncbi:MAG: ATP synthase subunit I [Halanaerobacter sp.]
MKEVKETTIFIIKWTLAAVFMISTFVFYLWGLKDALGIIAGSAMGISNLFLLSFSLKKAIGFEPISAGAYMIVQYLLKYGFWFFILYTLIKNNHINLFSTIIGMLIVKVVIFVINFFDIWPQHQNNWTG